MEGGAGANSPADPTPAVAELVSCAPGASKKEGATCPQLQLIAVGFIFLLLWMK